MKPTNLLAGVVTVCWLLLVGAGFLVLLDYGLTPGDPGQPPTHWPRASVLVRNRDGPTLLMAVHPHCPCTRASLAELLSIMGDQKTRIKAYVLFVRPPGVTPGWEHTDLWRSVAAIPSLTPVSDDLGREAKRFGAVTSGQTLLYDLSGKLQFSGGITAARGFYGDSAGKATIVALLADARAKSGHTAVYGCPLLNPARGRKVVPCTK
jgi:hypothetical protein